MCHRRVHSESVKKSALLQKIILMGVRWYLAYPLNSRHVEEMMEERGVEVDHATMSKASGRALNTGRKASTRGWGLPRLSGHALKAMRCYPAIPYTGAV